MKTAIIYKSRHGTTCRVAEMIASKLDGGNTALIDLSAEHDPDISIYDKIIIGGSIHVGKIQKELQKFCEKHLRALLKKELGLFICCMDPDEGVRKLEFENAYPKILREHSKANGIMGGEFLFDKLNFIEKIAIKRVAHEDKTVSKLDNNAIKGFIEAMA
jgi:menaquinone-dependent protoporphyrinogen oxidase